jgi:hypothetical protein
VGDFIATLLTCVLIGVFDGLSFLTLTLLAQSHPGTTGYLFLAFTMQWKKILPLPVFW